VLYVILAVVYLIVLILACIVAGDNWVSSKIPSHAKFNTFSFSFQIIGSILGMLGAALCVYILQKDQKRHTLFAHLLLLLAAFLVSSITGSWIEFDKDGGGAGLDGPWKAEFAFEIISQILWIVTFFAGGLGAEGYHGHFFERSKNRHLLLWALLTSFYVIALCLDITFYSDWGSKDINWRMAFPLTGGILGILAGLLALLHNLKEGGPIGKAAPLIVLLLLLAMYFESVSSRFWEETIFVIRLFHDDVKAEWAAAFSFEILAIASSIVALLGGGLSVAGTFGYEPIG